MFTPTSYKGFVNTLNVQTKGMTDKAAVDSLVRVAIRERDRVLRDQGSRKGFKPSYRQIVDSILGAPLDRVKPSGTIVFAWDYLDEIVSDTYGALVNRLPKVTGKLSQSVLVFVDGALGDASAIPPGTKEIKLVVSADYARRIEVGRKRHSFDPFSAGGHHAVVETQQVAKRLWGTAAQITFRFSDLSGGYALRTQAARHRRYHTGAGWQTETSARSRAGRPETKVLYPTIVIEPRGA